MTGGDAAAKGARARERAAQALAASACWTGPYDTVSASVLLAVVRTGCLDLGWPCGVGYGESMSCGACPCCCSVRLAAAHARIRRSYSSPICG